MAGFLYSKHIWQFFFYKINSQFQLLHAQILFDYAYATHTLYLYSMDVLALIMCKKTVVKNMITNSTFNFFKSHFQLQGQKIVRVDQTSHVPKFKSIIYRLYIKIYYIPQQYIIVLRYDLVKFSFLFPKVGLKQL